MIQDNDRIILTKHAWDRINELGVSRNLAVYMLHHSEEEKHSSKGERKRFWEYKRKKYSDRATYYRHGTFIFTTIRKLSKYSGEPIVLVITITDQRTTIYV